VPGGSTCSRSSIYIRQIARQVWGERQSGFKECSILTRRKIVVAFVLSTSLLAYGQQSSRYVVLPSTAARAVTSQCSRRAPQKIEGGWRPTRAVIEKMEAHLSRISTLQADGWPASIRIVNPARYYRQYIGVILAGRRMVYVNASCREHKAWTTRYTDVCDGATCEWGVLYDPQTGQFSELGINGRA
jgi:hypothetical protein